MTDHQHILAAVTAHEAASGQPISRLGYFCAPFRPKDGPLADKVIKVYQTMPERAALDRLAACHADYVAALLAAGVPMPETEFHLVDMGNIHQLTGQFLVRGDDDAVLGANP